MQCLVHVNHFGSWEIEGCLIFSWQVDYFLGAESIETPAWFLRLASNKSCSSMLPPTHPFVVTPRALISACLPKLWQRQSALVSNDFNTL